jgi:hypothetical protein
MANNEVMDLYSAYLHCVKNDIPVGAIATAIESEGIYTWDEYGRYHHANNGSDGVMKALEHLKIFCIELNSHWSDPVGAEEKIDQFWSNPELSPLKMFVWPESKTPNFKKLQEKWNKANLELDVDSRPPPEKGPATQATGLQRVMRGLFIKAFGADKFLEIAGSQRSSLTTSIASELSGEQIKVTAEDVRNWIARPLRGMNEDPNCLLNDYENKHSL